MCRKKFEIEASGYHFRDEASWARVDSVFELAFFVIAAHLYPDRPGNEVGLLPGAQLERELCRPGRSDFAICRAGLHLHVFLSRHEQALELLCVIRRIDYKSRLLDFYLVQIEIACARSPTPLPQGSSFFAYFDLLFTFL
jgi:hypothetical protein